MDTFQRWLDGEVAIPVSALTGLGDYLKTSPISLIRDANKRYLSNRSLPIRARHLQAVADSSQDNFDLAALDMDRAPGTTIAED